MFNDLIKEKFKYYIEKNFDLNDENIILKYNHSLRVMKLCENIAVANKFSKEDQETAALIGLLHDYARFDQWTKFKTFNDYDSYDHGDMAVEFLCKDNKIVEYSSDKSIYDVVYDAIKYHNKYRVPETLRESSLKFVNLIRDADKLDILYLFSENEISINEDDSYFSHSVLENFNNQKQVEYTPNNTNNDKILLILAFVFDLNYQCSYKIIKDNNYIDNIFKEIENKNKFSQYFEQIKKYIEKRVDENDGN